MSANTKQYLALLKRNHMLYSLLSFVYHKTPHYKNYLRKKQKNGDKAKNTIKRYLNNKYVVNHGPFSGVKYLSNSTMGSLLPKIIGSYEEPIQPWIKEVLRRKYSKIINLGSAEGYYAVGLAKGLPQSHVLASDIDYRAQILCNKLAKLNRCKNLTTERELSHEKLNKEIVKNNTLILCDIEGAEEVVLNPRKVPHLMDTDIICEVHDHVVARNITDTLLTRFHQTHTITIVVDNKRNLEKYSEILKLPKNTRAFALDEGRSGIAKWMRLLKRGN